MAPLRLPRRRRIRLPSEVYRRAGAICLVSIAVRERDPVFTNGRLADAAVRVIGDVADRRGILVHAFCVMPDHVHLVLQPGEGADLVAYVAELKRRVLREAWALGVHGTFWQASFHDHFLRAEEDLGHVIDYVLQNPVRAGLVESAAEYPYSGARGWTR